MVETTSRRRNALITGASAGIGKAFAQVLAEHGFDLILTARREERLRELATAAEKRHGAQTLVIKADLADTDAPQAIFDQAAAAGRSVDLLVNNAGYGIPEDYCDTEWAVQGRFIQVMATAPAHLTHLVLPGMIERGWGRIINVSSLAALMPGMAGHTLYAGVKSFLVKLSQSVSLEMGDRDVRAMAVCPGFTYSEFHDVIRTRESVSAYPGFMWMSAEDVARQAYEAMAKGKTVFVPGPANKALALACRLLPDSLLGKLSAQRQIVAE